MATTRGERLRMAREKQFKSARAAAADLRVAPATYGAHERAQAPGKRGRDYGPEEAELYGHRFKVRPEWLLTGKGKPHEAAVESSASGRLIESIDRLIIALDRHSERLEEIVEQIQAIPYRRKDDARWQAASGSEVAPEMISSDFHGALMRGLSLPRAQLMEVMERAHKEGIVVFPPPPDATTRRWIGARLHQIIDEVEAFGVASETKAERRA